MADERGNLALEYLRLVGRVRPTWCVWENVPGVLSSNGGRDFGAFLGGLVELGYGLAWRVLDAQHFGLAQRRERVFVVGCAGDWRRAAAVLFEPASLRGHPPPRREAGQTVAPTISARPTGGGGLGEGFDASEDGTGRGTPLVPIAFGWQNSASQGDSVSEHHTPTLDKSKTPAVAFMENQRGELRVSEQTDALTTGGGKPGQGYAAAATATGVRRLTPRECERLQGLPDDWTDVPYRGKAAADGPRYKAIGNGMAVPCLEWIGRRIAQSVPANETWPDGRGFLQRETAAPARLQPDLFASAAE
jgi:DNA (cytosine-5)-methyltransferase 1